MDAPKRKFSPAGIAGTLLGIFFGRYAGMNFLIPVAGTLLIAWVIKKRSVANPMTTAIAVQGGHVLWMVFGALIVGTSTVLVVEMILFTLGIGWLYLRPGLPAVVALGGYQVLALIVNVTSMAGVPLDSSKAKGLAVHVLLRVVAVGAMAWGLRASRRSSTTPVEPAAP